MQHRLHFQQFWSYTFDRIRAHVQFATQLTTHQTNLYLAHKEGTSISNSFDPILWTEFGHVYNLSHSWPHTNLTYIWHIKKEQVFLTVLILYFGPNLVSLCTISFVTDVLIGDLFCDDARLVCFVMTNFPLRLAFVFRTWLLEKCFYAHWIPFTKALRP